MLSIIPLFPGNCNTKAKSFVHDHDVTRQIAAYRKLKASIILDFQSYNRKCLLNFAPSKKIEKKAIPMIAKLKTIQLKSQDIK
ncbi:MAG: hypothetical protein MUD12_10505 [Spirochaetes bacterium]|jgi:hypothetical protein|nr:hypothetical protein [Spirochaetota bacterium]